MFYLFLLVYIVPGAVEMLILIDKIARKCHFRKTFEFENIFMHAFCFVLMQNILMMRKVKPIHRTISTANACSHFHIVNLRLYCFFIILFYAGLAYFLNCHVLLIYHTQRIKINHIARPSL